MTTADVAAVNRAKCNAYYAANRDKVQAARRTKRQHARAEELERAVLFGLPIGRTTPACGTRLAAAWHRDRGETCVQCAYVTAAQTLATTWIAPRLQARSAAAEKQHRYYMANRDRIRAANRAWAAANRDKMREYGRKHAQKPETRAKQAARAAADPEQQAAYKRAHYERVGRDAWRARGEAWAAAHREQTLAARRAQKMTRRTKGANDTALRRARVRALPADNVDRTVVWLRDNGICHICSMPADPKDWHLDHVMPIARGGAHVYANVAVSHPHCNQSKGARVA